MYWTACVVDSSEVDLGLHAGFAPRKHIPPSAPAALNRAPFASMSHI